MSTSGDRNTLAAFILALLAWLLLPGCTTVYHPNGNKALHTSADFQSLTFKSGSTSLTILGHRPSSNVRAVGSVVGTTLTSAAPIFLPTAIP